MNLEFNKYKRVFAFGCSFTSYLWPTWADIIAIECPNALFYNFGRSGAGNLAISCKIAEANNIFKFKEDDLLIILWSSFTREDRWFDGRWLCVGNVFGNHLYDEAWIKKYADPLGYLIRDMGLIHNTHKMLDTLPCTSLKLFSYSVKKNLDEGLPVENDKWYNKFMAAYETFINDTIKDTMFDYLKANIHPQEVGYKFLHSWEKQPSYDPHPNTLTYFKWLKHIGIPLTQRSYVYAQDSYEKLIKCSTQLEIIKMFPKQQDNIDDSYILLL